MELANANYLYTLALIAITYVGFTAIVLILRQSLGAAVEPIDALVARLFMGWGFLLTFSSMLPMALALYEFPPVNIWRFARAISGLCFVIMQISYPIVRWRVTHEPTPGCTWLRG